MRSFSDFCTKAVSRLTGAPHALLAALFGLLASTSAQMALAQTVFIHSDPLGNPIVATDTYGAVAWKQRYRPFGEPTVTAAITGNENRLWFHGKPYEPSSQLAYYGARYYDPLVGRFTGIDPKDPNAEDLHSLNRYAYGNNNPLRYQDPNGMWAEEILGSISLAISVHEFVRSPSLANAAVLASDLVLTAVPGVPAFVGASVHGVQGAKAVGGVAKALDASGGAVAAKGAADVGRAGKQARLRELANDDKLGSADRGWIKQELNSIDRGQRSTIRNPPGKDLAHERGREAAKGYDYSHSNLQDRDLHRLQHKYDDFGRANAERPLP